MNESTQQDEQSTDVELNPTDNTEGTQSETNEPGNTADNETGSLESYLEQFDSMATASEEARSLSENEPGQEENGSSDENTGDSQQTPETSNAEPDTRMDQMWENYQAQQRKAALDDVNNAVKVMKDSAPILKTMPDYVVKGALEELNRQDPRVGRAFSLRLEDPTLWNQTVKELGKKLQIDLSSRPDGEAGDNLAAIRASVTSQPGGQTHSGPTDDEISDMSPAEFAKYKAERFG